MHTMVSRRSFTVAKSEKFYYRHLCSLYVFFSRTSSTHRSAAQSDTQMYKNKKPKQNDKKLRRRKKKDLHHVKWKRKRKLYRSLKKKAYSFF